MVRNALGSLMALIGATAAVWSPFRAWYDGRHGRDVRIGDLFGGITPDKAELLGSLFLPMAFAGLVTLIGVLVRSRLLVALAGVVVLGFTILWMVRQGQAAGSLTAGGNGLGIGVAGALGGGVVLLLGALVMSGRDRRRRPEPDAPAYAPAYVPPEAPEPWNPGGPPARDRSPQPPAQAPEGPPEQSPGAPTTDPRRQQPPNPPSEPSRDPWPGPPDPR